MLSIIMEEKIKKIIADELQVPVSEITAETEIGEFDEWDSLRNLTIFVELQKEFNITITQDMLMDLENVADIIDLVKNLAK